MKTCQSIVNRFRMSFVISLALWVAATALSWGATNQLGVLASSEILPPAWVSASDGVYADRIVVSWAPWGSFTTNCIVNVYRSIGADVEAATCISFNSITGNGSSATPASFVDYGHIYSQNYGLSPYVKYYYWVMVGVQTNTSIFGSPQYNWSSLSSYAIGSAGLPRYKAAPADYNGDGLIDFATCQERTGNWRFLFSPDYTPPVPLNGFLGGDGFVPMPMDYDHDGKADPAVYNEETGEWRIRLSGSGYVLISVPGL